MIPRSLQRGLRSSEGVRMTYNFDPQRWYDNEYACLKRRHQLGQISDQAYKKKVNDLDIRLEEMWARVDGTYCIDNKDGKS